MDDKRIGLLSFSGELDSDDELEVEVDGNEHDFWINKDEACELIDHLMSVFKIER